MHFAGIRNTRNVCFIDVTVPLPSCATFWPLPVIRSASKPLLLLVFVLSIIPFLNIFLFLLRMVKQILIFCNSLHREAGNSARALQTFYDVPVKLLELQYGHVQHVSIAKRACITPHLRPRLTKEYSATIIRMNKGWILASFIDWLSQTFHTFSIYIYISNQRGSPEKLEQAMCTQMTNIYESFSPCSRFKQFEASQKCTERRRVFLHLICTRIMFMYTRSI